MPSKRVIQFSLATSILLGILGGGHVEACEYASPVPASRATRTYRDTNIGFSFDLPENYRAMGVNGGQTILVVEPSTYDLLQCLARSPYGTDTPQITAKIDVRPINSGQQTSLYNLVIQQYPWMRSEGLNFRNVTFSGTSAIAYFQRDLVNTAILQYVSLRSSDRRHLITISGPSESREFGSIGNSFHLQ